MDEEIKADEIKTIAMNKACELITPFEICRLQAYKDEEGILAIGWHERGILDKDLKWTQEQADHALNERIKTICSQVLAQCPVLIEHTNKLAACIAMSFDIGIYNFRGSLAARYINRREFRAAADAFLSFSFRAGRYSRELDARRRIERDLFLKE